MLGITLARTSSDLAWTPWGILALCSDFAQTPHGLGGAVQSCDIQFYIPGAVGGAVESSYIEAIWEIPLEGTCQISLLVQQYQPLSPAQL